MEFCTWLEAHGSSCLEFVAVVFGIVSVWLSTRENILSWPTAIVNVSLFSVLFYRAGLYSDTGLQGVYFALSVYGWYEWLYGGKNKTALAVSTTSRRAWMMLIGIGVVSWLILSTVTARLPGTALPRLDAATTTISLIAMYLMTRKKVENWLLWVGVDVVYVGMFFYKGLYLTAFNYGVYLVISATGWFSWRRSLRETGDAPGNCGNGTHEDRNPRLDPVPGSGIVR